MTENNDTNIINITDAIKKKKNKEYEEFMKYIADTFYKDMIMKCPEKIGLILIVKDDLNNELTLMFNKNKSKIDIMLEFLKGFIKSNFMMAQTVEKDNKQ